MVTRRPLVLISGQQTELPPGDSLLGTSIGSLSVSSGLSGGGDLSGNTTTFVAVAPNPSGVIFVGDKLALDGSALRQGQAALASGNYALEVGNQALTSGVIANSVANAALASGNAVLTAIPQIPNGVLKTFTAAGGIQAGYPVGLDETGSVQAVGVVKYPESRYLSGDKQIEPYVIYNQDITSISGTNNFLGVLRGPSNYGYAYVASVSGSNIYNTTPIVFESTYLGFPNLSFDEVNNRYNLCYLGYLAPNYRARTRSITVSGSDLYFSTAVIVDNSVQSSRSSLNYIPDQQNFAFVYNDTSNALYAITLTPSGSTYVPGARITVNTGANPYPSSVYDPINKKVVTTYQAVTTGYGESKLLTVSGSTLSAGSATTFESAGTTWTNTVYDPVNNKVFISYNSAATGKVVVGTAAASNLAVGTPVVFTSNALTEPASMAYDTANDRCVLTYRASASLGNTVPVSSSGYTISLGSESTFTTNNIDTVKSTFSSDINRIYVAYRNNSAGNSPSAVISSEAYLHTPTLSGYTNYIGIAQSAATSGSSVAVRLPGSYETLISGLNAGLYYYLDPLSSGITVSGTRPAAWSGQLDWAPVGRALKTDVLLLTDMI